MLFCISENFCLKEAEKRRKICFSEEKNARKLCMFQKCCTFAPSNKKRQSFFDFGLWCNGNTTDSGPVFLGSSPSSPTSFMPRLHGGDKALLGYGVMVTQQILVLFFLVRIRVAQQKRCSDFSGHLFCFLFFILCIYN